MALTELKRPTKADFYNVIKVRASTLYNAIDAIKKLSEDLALMDGATLDAIGIPVSGSDEGLRSDLVTLRTMCNELVSTYNGTALTQTVVPATLINKLRNF